MLTNDELFVIIKLTSGEQMMAVLKSEDERYVELESPMTIRTIPIMGEQREHITAHPFCQFSDDKNFVLDKRNVMFVKKLHHVFIPHYKRIVAEHEKPATLVTRDHEEIVQHDPEELEEVRKKVELLQRFLGSKKEEDKEYRFLVDGNDTIN